MHITVDAPNPSLTERFVVWLCNELNVAPDTVVIQGDDDIGDGILGLCVDVSDSDFLIMVKTSDRNIGEVFNTIAHEMIHVKQYMTENLGWFLDNRFSIPYHQRWWEVEAFSKSLSFVEKFAKGL